MRSRITVATLAMSATLGVAATHAESARLSALDPTGAPLGSVLVIVRSLEGRGEVFRALTASSGDVLVPDLAPGLYRVIATYPQGPWRTLVREFLVHDSRLEVQLEMGALPTKDELPVARRSMTLQCVDKEGVPVPGVAVLVRDAEASREAWYKTNSGGEADVDIGLLMGGPVTLVAVYQNRLTERTLSRNEVSAIAGKPQKVTLRVL